MSAEHTEHLADAAVHPHDPAEEIAHAREHARENMYIFAGFFTLVLVNVVYYEFFIANTFWILVLAALRAIGIAFFMNWLFRSFSFVFRTFLFTIFFLAGMIALSIWDSELGDPIKIPKNYNAVPAQKSAIP
jgi:hypothetical protein